MIIDNDVPQPAWKVDFNISLASMEPLVAGTRRLIDFAISSPQTTPPRFLFVSSASVVRAWTGGGSAPEVHVSDPAVAVGSGYGEAKWVAEGILNQAAHVRELPIVIVRPTQMCGSINGEWKANDWFPALLRSSQTIGIIPRVSGHISWVPVDQAAQALVEMRSSKEPYLHLAHPKPVQVSLILAALSDSLHIPIVAYSDWLAAVEAAGKDANLAGNPAVRLLDFFRSIEENAEDTRNPEAFFSTSLATGLGVAAAPTLQSLSQLGPQDAQRWVAYWRKTGFLES